MVNVYNPPGTNAPDPACCGAGIVTENTGAVFVAQTPEQFTYDSDGNLLSDGRFTYTCGQQGQPLRAAGPALGQQGQPLRMEFSPAHGELGTVFFKTKVCR